MGSLFRSEPMTLCQLFLQTDAAFASVAQLGELGLCQFTDLNPDVSSYARKYVSEVKRCDELERRIGYIGSELAKAGIPVPDAIGPIPTPLPRDMADLEEKLERLEAELRLIDTAKVALRDDYIKISDVRHVLLKMSILFDEGQRSQAMQSIADAQHGIGGPLPPYTNGFSTATGGKQHQHVQEVEKEKHTGGGASDLRFLAGVLRTSRVVAFERVLWRMCHGKVFVRTLDIDEDENAPFRDGEKKSAFMLFFSGGELQSKVRKICDGFRANLVENCSESSSGLKPEFPPPAFPP